MTSKTTTQKSTSQSQSGPGAKIEPYWDKLLSGASDIFQQNASTPFEGALFADPTAAQRQAVDMMKQGAPALAQGAGTVRGLADRIAGGEFLDVANNPYFQGSANAIASNVSRELSRRWLPATTDEAIKQGAYAGSGTERTNQNLIGESAKRVAEAQAGLASNYFNTGAGLTGQIPTLYNQSNAMMQAPAQQIGLAGTQEQAWNQGALDAALQKWKMDANDPLQQYSQFANLLNASGYKQGTSSGTQETTTPAPDMATMILQGALGVAGMASGLGPAMPGIMTGFNALKGGLGSIFGGGGAAAPTTSLQPYDPLNAHSGFGYR